MISLTRSMPFLSVPRNKAIDLGWELSQALGVGRQETKSRLLVQDSNLPLARCVSQSFTQKCFRAPDSTRLFFVRFPQACCWRPLLSGNLGLCNSIADAGWQLIQQSLVLKIFAHEYLEKCCCCSYCGNSYSYNFSLISSKTFGMCLGGTDPVF